MYKIRNTKFLFRAMLLAGVCLAALTASMMGSGISHACQVAAISMGYTANGRPMLWKNRDDAFNFLQSLQRYDAVNPRTGAYICLEEYFWVTGNYICSGGVNEAGFAVMNASVYEATAVHEILNVDVDVIREALEDCTSVECFENLLATWNDDRPDSTDVISSNFAVMDAHGNAVLLEANTEKFGGKVNIIRHDANSKGYVNHTNYNSFIGNPGVERRERATALLNRLGAQRAVTPLNVMQQVTKDVCDDVADQPLERFPTKFCVSRAITTAGIVIEGVAPGQDPRLTTMWANLGEPSVGVYVPVFPAAPLPARVDSGRMGGSRMNVAIVLKEHKLYDNNGWINGIVPRPLTDTHMRKDLLPKIQNISFPIEEELYMRTENFVNELMLSPGNITAQRLYAFAQESTEYAYQKYLIETLPWYNKNPVSATAAVLALGVRMARNSRKWATSVFANREELYQDAKEGVLITARYLKEQLPNEVEAIREAIRAGKPPGKV